jgi:N utilization substance protein B
MSESPRSRAREMVLQALYAIECGENEPGEELFAIDEDDPPPERALSYARQLIELVRANTEKADQDISRLATNWKIERLAAIDRNILRLAIVELDHMVDVPVKVVLNEAIELAKKFSTDESSSFVNGILDKYAGEMEDVRRA